MGGRKVAERIGPDFDFAILLEERTYITMKHLETILKHLYSYCLMKQWSELFGLRFLRGESMKKVRQGCDLQESGQIWAVRVKTLEENLKCQS